MPSKRALDVNERVISPPPNRRKLTTASKNEEEEFAMADAAPSSSETVLIYSWNVNGILLFPLRTFLQRHQWPHFLCLQEVKINAKDLSMQKKLVHAANAGNRLGEPTYAAHFSLPRDKYNTIGFGGKVHGLATLIRDDFAQNVKSVRNSDWDLEGRVQTIELNKNLVVINGYWVNGTSNPYRDPDTGAISGTRHDYKLRFHKRMLDGSMELQARGMNVVLIGDMNIARSRNDGHPNLRTSPEQHVKNRYDFNQKFFDSEAGMQGVDVFRHFHGEKQKYTYHGRGYAWGTSCDRIDLIIASRGLIEKAGAVTATDICDNPEDRGHSDHVPLWIGLDWEKLPRVMV